MGESFMFQDKAPYPPIAVCAKNREYAAAMVSNIGACNSEMSAVSLYFYNSMITKESFGEVAECFHKISIVEMRHLDIFGQLTLKLGMDPRLWQCRNGKMEYWSPECNRYPDRILLLLENSLITRTDIPRTVPEYFRKGLPHRKQRIGKKRETDRVSSLSVFMFWQLLAFD